MSSPRKSSEQQTPAQRQEAWEPQLAEMQAPVRPLQGPDFNLPRFALVGLLLGGMAGSTSLLLNVIGSTLWPSISGEPQHPLRLIQVYLTFPLGESALELNSGAALALGCLLYIATGMLYGVLFEVVLSYFMPYAGTWARISICSVLSLILWGVNYYAFLLWLQPVLLGGNWIVSTIPAWVAVITHLVFGWTMALLYPLGEGRLPRRPQV